MSRSVRSSRVSLRSRANSSRSAVVSPVRPFVRSARARVTHTRRARLVRLLDPMLGIVSAFRKMSTKPDQAQACLVPLVCFAFLPLPEPIEERDDASNEDDVAQEDVDTGHRPLPFARSNVNPMSADHVPTP